MLKDRLNPGAVLDQGRFEVKRAIKAGGMGAVYEVVDRALGGKTFALKEMLNPGNDTEEQQSAGARFISEVRVMQTLRHPNIPKVTASFMHGNSFYFVMELIQGVDLSQKLKESGKPGLPQQQVVNWSVQVLDALDYLHQRVPPVVHRDIKPSNLLLCEEYGRVVLIDFGISCVANPGEGLWIGTPGYAPPEQQYGRPEPRSDLYALGATMHHLLSGIKPTDFEFAQLDTLGLDIDKELSAIIAQAVIPWPDERTPSASTMAGQLRGLRNIQVQSPRAQGLDFDGAVHSFKEEVLDPALKDLMTRYGNECYTRFLPHNLDFLQFVLGSPTPFELQIIKEEERGVLSFLEKEGILAPRNIGEVDPRSSDRALQLGKILDQYLQDFESFKSNSGWGVGF